MPSFFWLWENPSQFITITIIIHDFPRNFNGGGVFLFGKVRLDSRTEREYNKYNQKKPPSGGIKKGGRLVENRSIDERTSPRSCAGQNSAGRSSGVLPWLRGTAFFLILTMGLMFGVGCRRFAQKQRFAVTVVDLFDTVTELIGYADSRAEFDAQWEPVYDTLHRLHRLYDAYSVYENVVNVATINQSVGQEERHFRVEEELFALLLFGKNAYAWTEGKVNAAMGCVTSLWKEAAETGVLPSETALASAATHSSYDSIVLEASERTVTIRDSQLKLDVGAIAKGFALRKARELLIRAGAFGYCLNLGGTVCAFGTKPDGNAFVMGIRGPSGDSYVRTLALTGQTVTTSGNAYRFFTVDGHRYSHLIDPFTCFPAETFYSVTVTSEDPAEGDVFSTALFCMSEAEGRALLAKHPMIRALWIDANGKITETEGFGDTK